MSVALRRQRNGSPRPFWYGEYRDANGKRKVVNLGEWRGVPPVDRGGAGDAAFEASREDAEVALRKYAEEARRKGRVEHIAERLIEDKTGQKVEYVRISDLPERWRDLGREEEVTEQHLLHCDAHFRRFIGFMREHKPGAAFLYEVAAEDVSAFVKKIRRELSPATSQYTVRMLNKALGRFLPVGAVNPFSKFVGRRKKNGSGVIHRRPFSPEELAAIIATAADDEFMHPLIVTAACTGMRRGDVCTLQWSAVDLVGGMLAVKTSKTDEPVEIPIFEQLREVLEKRNGPRNGFVFPEAATMLAENPMGLSYRFKKIIARALDESAPEPEPEIVNAADVEQEGLAAIRENIPEGTRRERMEETFSLYAAGESLRAISSALEVSRSTTSVDLHAVEEWVGVRFMRRGPGKQSGASISAAIDRTTRKKRKRGQRAASIRDWHALRTTFVTLALSAGVPVELVQIVTGHRTVQVVMDHYFKPGREQFKAALTRALPDVLTGRNPAERITPAEDLAALAVKLARGTASESDKDRFRELARDV